ncbi:MAG: CsbD family protein [Kiritimatiellae bacterium]|jgi:uncharacterized protein YjbJ (UPF0337 family)|nr:CsbD family protein [Kiritimatiellia bacterium]
MKGTTNVLKGRIKEAAGALTGNSSLRAKGRKDQALGRIEQGAEKGVRKAKDAADDIVDRAKDIAEKEVDNAKIRKS